MPLIRNRSTNRSFGLTLHKGSSFAAGVSTPEEVCYNPLYLADGVTTSGLTRFTNNPALPSCPDLGDPNQPAELRNANVRAGGATGDFQSVAHATAAWQFSWGLAETSYITPAEIVLGTINGVTSGQFTTLTDMSRNAATGDTFGCMWQGPGLTLNLVGNGPTGFTKYQWMQINTFASDIGNAKAGDVQLLRYNETLHTAVPVGADTIDWSTTGYFLPNEVCYFASCPKAVLPGAITQSTVAFNGSLPLRPSCAGGFDSAIPGNHTGYRLSWDGTGQGLYWAFTSSVSWQVLRTFSLWDLTDNVLIYTFPQGLVIPTSISGSTEDALCWPSTYEFHGYAAANDIIYQLAELSTDPAPSWFGHEISMIDGVTYP